MINNQRQFSNSKIHKNVAIIDKGILYLIHYLAYLHEVIGHPIILCFKYKKKFGHKVEMMEGT